MLCVVCGGEVDPTNPLGCLNCSTAAGHHWVFGRFPKPLPGAYTATMEAEPGTFIAVLSGDSESLKRAIKRIRRREP